MSRGHDAARRGRLYVVATPIGNLADITLRALETLRTVDIVFAEDTRDARRLLAHHGITTKLASLHEHNEPDAARAMLRLLAAGRDAALVTDAGTPAISDPGALAVREARAAGFAVVPVPGANAAIAALSVAGLQGSFAFIGFLPAKAAARRRALESWRTFAHTLVFYEAPHRILECVDDLAAVLGGERIIVLARELTKAFETVHAGPLAAARAWLEEDPNRLRGEFVIVVSGAPAPAAEETAEGERVLLSLLRELPVSTAVRLAAEITGAPRKPLYETALTLKEGPSRTKRRK